MIGSKKTGYLLAILQNQGGWGLKPHSISAGGFQALFTYRLTTIGRNTDDDQFCQKPKFMA